MGFLGRVVSSFAGAIVRAAGNDPGVYDLGFPSSAVGEGGGPRRWLRVYGRNAKLQSVVRRIAHDVALVKWHVYREIAGPVGPNGPQKERLVDHPLERLWKRPCPHLVGFQFRYLVQLYLELDGECAIIIERPPGTLIPKALWVIPKTWITRRPRPSDPTWGVSLGSAEWPLPAGEVIWLHDPDPENPYSQGLGVARSVDDQVQQSEWMAKFNNQFFRNGAHPHQVFALEGVDLATGQQLKADYEQKYSGFWSAFKTAWLMAPKGGTVKVHSTAANHKDMDFVEGEKSGRDGILQAFNMPRFEVGISEDVNRASAQASDYTKSKNVTLPRITYLEEAWDSWLVPLYNEPGLRLIPEQVVRQTEEFRLQKSSEGLLNRALSVNEWRKENGYDPRPEAWANELPRRDANPNDQAAQQRAIIGEVERLNPEAARILEKIWRTECQTLAS